MHVDSHAGHLVEPMHVGHLLIADFTQQHTPKQPDANLRATSSSISRQALVKASSAAQCGEDVPPRQHIGSLHAAMFPPAPMSILGMGYSSNHIVHGQHRNKMLAATIAPQRHVIVCVALHHLKAGGKSGTELVGNIERDIRVDVGSKAMVGPPGSFKTCHPATLHLKQSQNPLSTKLTAILQLHNIVAKHLYFHDPPGMNTSVSLLTPSKKQKHLAIKDELIEMLDEANCLYLAGSLMDLLYDWTDKLVAVKKSCSPVIKIPQLCFVHSALAIPQNVQDSQAAVYLLEEKINRNSILLSSSASLNIALFLCFAQYCSLPLLRSILLSSSASLNIALFLCFTQYAQFKLMRGLVFLSGCGDILSDPKIITTLDYAGNFGEGNWTSTLDNLYTLYECNTYCTFFGLSPLLAPERSTSLKVVAAGAHNGWNVGEWNS
ncbi:hypothetical protein SERLADRAFT_437833 [Serpula lacrymans var. lacrymans S7.9]|uniref:Alpha-type protein kinase domain-containing protein n=1 Tax=Serpula lacrymans var. lacrymans (strain S7.9) TaxID=578457 RepID=F8NY24_SERL9|nr:uncharacterized protein SERLADRAFT_437833 [Serpula lacrymans var. lacrymans S7.9]EGO24216.1 hypothetical protein SERLADRAFT_437833 [Serpula lacrymans var. lacrymans S7.9]